MPINTKQLIELVIQPTLIDLNLYSLKAEMLLAGTCAQESHMGTYIAQVNGPALGIYQMEKATHDDIWKNYINSHETLKKFLPGLGFSEDLIYDLRYATLMARIHYLRVKQPLPYSGTTPTCIAAFADYWKRHYNTPKGKGTEQQFIDNFNRYVLPYYQEK